ncbi:SDR family NAD(P)-dependent oxidoreductase [Actinosynnema sp. NPDC023658]|uniref:SDR family NAD(P)-dependent oxidoreductase n=1 Tax=Actinosynnema sp. NPDC023658 TaxID=3155465 RepID=UPI0033E9A9D9
MRDLDGRVVAVTGGGRGLGLLVVRALLSRGAMVVANHRSRSADLEALLEEYGDELQLVRGDIAEERVAAELTAAAGEFGRLDVVVHNAGITRDTLLVRMSVEEWDDVIRVNLRGAFLATKHALRLMMRQRYGRFVYVSSLSAAIGNRGQANYAASKAALHGLSHSVAQEYAAYNVRSVVLAPGLLDTGLGTRLDQATQDRLAGQALLGIGGGESIAQTVAFLAGPAADYINATVINSHGGIRY